MRGGLLAGLAAVAALLVLGAATAGWVTSTTPGTTVDGVQLPADVVERPGATEAPASVLAAAAAFLMVLPLSLTGLADRAGATAGSRLPGTLARSAATSTGVATAALAGVALLGQLEVSGARGADAATTAAPGLFAAGALLVLGLGLLAWRVPRRAGTTVDTSRYTVEAVKGETPPPPEEPADEWDLAVGDTETAAGEETMAGDETMDHDRTMAEDDR